MRDYFEDVDAVWGRLDLMPRTFRAAEGSVMVFGEADGETEDGRRIADVVWVWRLRANLVASVEAFQVPQRAGHSAE